MRRSSKTVGQLQPNKLVDFLEAAYDVDTDDQGWLAALVRAARAGCGPGYGIFGCAYDASSLDAFIVRGMAFDGFCDSACQVIKDGETLHTREFVARTYRALLTARMRDVALPEMSPVLTGMQQYGFEDSLIINGLDPSGHGVILALWSSAMLATPPSAVAAYRRMAHHLGAAYRIRRRLNANQGVQTRGDLMRDAEAILDSDSRVVHAIGPARHVDARGALEATSRARELVRGSARGDALTRWAPLTQARWTLVDTFDRSGTRYIVARENEMHAPELPVLTERERQVVACFVLGQSAKEIAYALGISDSTVRVLLGRAATRLGVRGRRGLLNHPAVRRLSAS